MESSTWLRKPRGTSAATGVEAQLRPQASQLPPTDNPPPSTAAAPSVCSFRLICALLVVVLVMLAWYYVYRQRRSAVYSGVWCSCCNALCVLLFTRELQELSGVWIILCLVYIQIPSGSVTRWRTGPRVCWHRTLHPQEQPRHKWHPREKHPYS